MPRELQAGGATRFRSGPYPVQLVYKWRPSPETPKI
jgi:hypothetical protein